MMESSTNSKDLRAVKIILSSQIWKSFEESLSKLDLNFLKSFEPNAIGEFEELKENLEEALLMNFMAILDSKVETFLEDQLICSRLEEFGTKLESAAQTLGSPSICFDKLLLLTQKYSARIEAKKQEKLLELELKELENKLI
ncbi:MAG: hypothetical protein MHMPM18_000376 [Marteilia pararefringens]